MWGIRKSGTRTGTNNGHRTRSAGDGKRATATESLLKFRIFVLGAALAAGTLGAGVLAAQESGISVGKRAPAAAVTTLDGKAANLASYIGKGPVLIEFWATWCPNCRELEPSLLAEQKKYASRVVFVGVAVSVNQSPARVKAYVAKHGIRHDIVFDTNGNAAEAYDVTGHFVRRRTQRQRRRGLHGPRRNAGPRGGDSKGTLAGPPA